MNDISPSRREFVAGAALAAGVAGAAAPALAQDKPKAAGAPTTPAAARYPKPPFPVQRQPWPGLASRMEPRPDHGETNYRGSGKLSGKRALITGGDSGIGRAAAIAYAREGVDVVINHLAAEQSDADEVLALIRSEGRRGESIAGDRMDQRFAERLPRQAAERLGGLDIPVNNAARQQAKPDLQAISPEEFDLHMKTNVCAPF